MIPSCNSTEPKEKKLYLEEIGKILVYRKGKESFYKPVEVKIAHKESKWRNGPDSSSWAMSIFSSHQDFDEYHQQLGQDCDYVTMRRTMLRYFSNDTQSKIDWTEILADSSDDISWLDFTDVLGDVLLGIGEFISEILD